MRISQWEIYQIEFMTNWIKEFEDHLESQMEEETANHDFTKVQ